ncbi:hypothetical protein P692DRAFT_20745521 [Suillus brevipes Sb2]|nr:hypothetical protein P692DRAFT_20745521 [Suillus brevipes Sb2]
MQAFIDIIVRYKRGPGVFGHCKAYYGMVEAQGRGTLHCHFLLWIAGNPSPQRLRDRMATEDGFSDKMFAWLESIISCELPGDTGPIVETSSDQAKKPRRSADEPDPRLETPPQVSEMDRQSFEHEFTEYLTRLAVECNWHVHNDTCFKHVTNGQKRDDSTCRMRVDGSVQDVSAIDPESGSIELRRWRGRVNNFTDLILFLLQCNTDTQFIGSGEAAKATVFYTTEYITKTDLPLHVGLQALDYATKMHDLSTAQLDDMSRDKKDRTLITKSVNAMMGKQEMSHQQVMSYLVGGGDHYSSHVFHTFKWYEFVDAIQNIDDVASLLSDELDEASEPGGNSNEEVTVNISHDRVEFSSDFMDYTLRPMEEIFSKLCLWEFVEGTVKEKGKISDKQEAVASADSDLDADDIVLSRPIRKRLPRAQFMSAHSQFETHITLAH